VAITVDDLVWRSPENRTQFDDGGGRMTTTVVQPDTPGEVFPIISRQDGSYGRVHLAKVFAAVDTPGTETLYGAGGVLLEKPTNPGVDIGLLATGTAGDRRSDARARLEAYLVKGPETRLTLFGQHYANSRTVVAYQKPGQPFPAIGDRLFFYIPSPAHEQVVKVDDLSVEQRSFDDGNGTYTLDMVTMQIFPALNKDYVGEGPSRSWIVTKDTYILTPSLADATRIYGMAQLTDPIAADETVATVDTVMGRVCPVAVRETALSLRNPAGVVLEAATGGQMSMFLLRTSTWTGTYFTPTPMLPGSVRIQASYRYAQDNGDGTFTFSNLAATSLTVDYETGAITGVGVNTTWDTQDWYVYYTPAAFLPVSAYSKSQPITIATRGLVYVDTLSPLPGKRTISVDYLAFGQWYQLTDDGNGVLAGAASTYGQGTIDYTTGAVTLTLGAMPDLDSEVIFRWGSEVGYQTIATADVGSPSTVFDAPDLTPGNVTATWTSGGATKTLALTGWTSGVGTVTTANGTLTADVGKQSITVEFATSALPDVQTDTTIDYFTAPENRIGLSPGAIWSNECAFSFGQAIVPGSLDTSSFIVSANSTPHYSIQDNFYLFDDGAGTVKLVNADRSLGTFIPLSVPVDVGTIDYETGDISVSLDGATLVTELRYVTAAGTTLPVGTLVDMSFISIATASASAVGTPTAEQQTSQITALVVNIDNQGGILQENTLGLAFGAHTYYDRGGVLYRSIDATTNAGTAAGTVDYDNNAATLTSWANGATKTVRSGLTGPQAIEISASKFRSAGSPLREGSCSFQAEYATAIISAADNGAGGILVGDTAIGLVDYGTGSIGVDFSLPVQRETFSIRWVAASGVMYSAGCDATGEIQGQYANGTLSASGVLSMTINTQLPIPDSIRVSVERASNTLQAQGDQDGDFGIYGTVRQTTGIFSLTFPAPILAESIKYSAVQQTTVSLNSALIGLDPLRLPITGTVPIFRDGDSVLVHHADTDTLPNPLSAGQAVTLSRTDLGDVEIRDANGLLVSNTLYTVDLENGVITFATPLDLSAYVQPLVANHRIQARGTLAAVDLSGRLDLLVPLGREFPAGSAVSSIVAWGDLMARAENLFDQATWTGVWSNIRIGSDASGAYNTLTHPILLTNTAAVTERWRATFTSSTAFSVFGETVGGVGSGTISTNFAPMNSATGMPYFTIQSGGWGTGWATGNTVRFNTIGGQPLWITRSVQPGTTPGADSFRLGILADIDPLEA
jgi:hypothetical protein